METKTRLAQFVDRVGLAQARRLLRLYDVCPRARYLDSMAPGEELIWQDPIPIVDHELIGERNVRRLKAEMIKSGLTAPQLVRTAWASASTNRDMRGGANGARTRLAPQISWAANDPAELSLVLDGLTTVQLSLAAKN